MIVIPAIDLKGGRCVHLVEGRLGTERVVAEDAVTQARAFEAAGAARLHIVDLDGAFEGRPVNMDLIARMIAAVNIPVQVGGGLRDAEAVDRVLSSGATFAIIGTMAVTDPDLLGRIAATHPGQIIAGVDAKGGKVATEGWVTESSLTTEMVARRAQELGVSAVVTTDIQRDGTGLGVNVTDTDRLAKTLTIDVIASGGVAGIEDVRVLAKTTIFGVVVGRALYDGALDLEDAIAACG